MLIVGYQSLDLLIDCLDGLFEHTRGPVIEVLYTDCSNDGSMQVIRERYPLVRVIDNTENLGFGRGNNFLARHALGDYLLLLNPDTLIKDNAVGNLYDFALRSPQAGAWGGVTRLPGGGVDPGCRQSGPGLVNGLLQLAGLGRWTWGGLDDDAREPAEVPALSGAFMMVDRELWERLGGFDETFFMYCEETDLCFRIRKAGRPVMMTPHASIVHLVGSGLAQSPKRMLALTRGGMHMSRKHFGPIYVAIDATVRWLYSATRYAMGVLGRPIIGAERAAQLRARHAPILCHPGQWVGGWSEPRNPAPPKGKPSL